MRRGSWDHDIEHITAQVLRQGEDLAQEDRLSVILDPYLDRRNGYRFQVNPNGVRWEALYQDTDNLESNWDGIWQGAASRDADGWTAEMAIPFKTLSFNPNNAEWGINFERTIQRNSETLGLGVPQPSAQPERRRHGRGVRRSASRAAGLDVVPSASVREDKVYSTGRGLVGSRAIARHLLQAHALPERGLTLNTDFSATEVDDRQVNLTRFNLFFPEKRDFFLTGRRYLRVRPHRWRRFQGGGRAGGEVAEAGAAEEAEIPRFRARPRRMRAHSSRGGSA